MIIQAEIIFSIPGRVRLNVPDLLKNKKMAESVCSSVEDMQGVISVRPNTRTGNILVCYRTDITGENEILGRIKNFENGRGTKGFEHGRGISGTVGSLASAYGLSRRFVKAAFLIGGIVFLFKFMIRRLIATLVFAFPVIYFAAPAAVLYYGVKRAGRQRIFVKDPNSLDRLRNTESVYISDSVFTEEHGRELKDFVFHIRENGITDLAVVTEKGGQRIEREADALGIDKIYNMEENLSILDFFHRHALTVTAKELAHGIRELQKGLVLYVSGKDGNEIKQPDISVRERELGKIPWLIGLSRYCREVTIRSQNSATAINSLGILFASLGFLSPAGAIAFYGANTALQVFLIKNSILSYQKDSGRG